MTFVDVLMLHLLVKKNIISSLIYRLFFTLYLYFFLLYEKFQAMETLEVYITKVERQLERKVKIIKSDRGG